MLKMPKSTGEPFTSIQFPFPARDDVVDERLLISTAGGDKVIYRGQPVNQQKPLSVSVLYIIVRSIDP